VDDSGLRERVPEWRRLAERLSDAAQ